MPDPNADPKTTSAQEGTDSRKSIPSEPTKGSKRLLGWNVVRDFIAVLGIVLAVYFYLESIRKRDLSLSVNPSRTLIVRNGRSSDLHVLYKGQPVSTDVTALQVGLWNAGKESIKPGDVLEPIILQTYPKVPILEAKLTSVRRQSITNPVLDTSRLSDGQVGITWRILEHKDAVVIQLIVAGSIDETIKPQGALEGQSSVTVIEHSSSNRWYFLYSLAMVAFAGLCTAYLSRKTSFRESRAGSPLWRTATFWMLIIVWGFMLWLGSTIRTDDSQGPVTFDTKMVDDRPATRVDADPP